MHKKEQINLTAVLLSNSKHCSQILCGLKILQKSRPEEYALTIEDRRNDLEHNPYARDPFVNFLLLKYRGQNIIFDVDDGYNNIDKIRYYLNMSDFYFKRSFSQQKNKEFLSEFCSPQELDNTTARQFGKIRPLGLYYFVTYPHNPFNRSIVIQVKRWLQGLRRNDSYFTPDVFENGGKLEITESPRILFYTRLWDPGDSENSEWYKQCMRINTVRCEVIRALRKKYNSRFTGGLQKSKYALKVARDLIVSSKETERSRYLNLMKSSDICIASTDLFDSIGGKMGEYVASAKAIVSEKLLYEVTGDFTEGKNYLSFDGVEDCLAKVDFLVNHPQLVYEMKLANKKYYEEYLKPDVLVRNALRIVDQSLDQRN